MRLDLRKRPVNGLEQCIAFIEMPVRLPDFEGDVGFDLTSLQRRGIPLQSRRAGLAGDAPSGDATVGASPQIRGGGDDPQERLRMGRAGRQAILEEFTPRTTGPAMADFLKAAVPAQH